LGRVIPSQEGNIIAKPIPTTGSAKNSKKDNHVSNNHGDRAVTKGTYPCTGLFRQSHQEAVDRRGRGQLPVAAHI
jgi:hypothetical protein